jgi:hypothetical protein
MKSLTLIFSAVLCLTAIPAFAGAALAPTKSITLAEAEVTIGPNGVGVGGHDRDHARDRDRDHDRTRMHLDRDHDRGCRTVTVEERGETRTTRRCN